MQKAVLIWFLLLASGLVTASAAQAADLNAIKSQVEQRVEERQQQTQLLGSPAPGLLEPGAAATQPSQPPSVTTTHWTLFNGAIRLHTLNNQLYLSLFS